MKILPTLRGRRQLVTDVMFRVVMLLLMAAVALHAALAEADVPILNSDRYAPHVIFLDFDGHYEPATMYQCPWGSPEGWPIDFSTVDVSDSLSDAEVRDIWQAVAEDFAPFDVNVTTDPRKDPVPGAANAVRIAIGISSLGLLGAAPAVCTSDLQADPPYLNPRISHVAVVHLDPASVHVRETAKKISHEAGHLYGLVHHTAPAAPLDDWIMAPISSATRFIWRDGTNEFGASQNDPDQLAWLLGRRSDEPNPASLMSTGLSIDPTRTALYYHGTLTTRTDTDDFWFAPARSAQYEFRVSPGIWTSALYPQPGSEPNARYSFTIKTQNGSQTVACPSGQTITLQATTQPTVLWDCQRFTPALHVGTTYRIRVFHGGPSWRAGNIGRYTLTVRDVTPKPKLEPIGTLK